MRTTLSQQLQQMNDKNTELQNNMNLLVQQANMRIQEEVTAKNEAVAEAKEEVKDQLAKAAKDLEAAKSNSKYYSDRNTEFQKQFDNLHDMLDLIPNVLPRYKNEDKYNEYPLASRLMSYFVTKA